MSLCPLNPLKYKHKVGPLDLIIFSPSQELWYSERLRQNDCQVHTQPGQLSDLPKRFSDLSQNFKKFFSV